MVEKVTRKVLNYSVFPNFPLLGKLNVALHLGNHFDSALGE